MDIIPQNLLGDRYLKSRPYVYNGGIGAQFLSNFILNNMSVNVYFNIDSDFSLQNYIKKFLFFDTSKVLNFDNLTLSYKEVNKSNILTSVTGLLYIIFTFIICFVFCLFWIFYKKCKRNPFCQKWFENFSFITYSFKNFSFISNSKLMQKKKKKFQVVIIFCMIGYLLFIPFLCCFIFSTMLQSNLQQQMMSSNNNFSFSNSWQQSSKYLDEYFDIIILRSNFTFKSSLDKISATIKNLLSGSLNKLINEMLRKVGIYEIFINANRMIMNLNETSQGMIFIKDNSARILKNINLQTGRLNEIVEELRYLVKMFCYQLPVQMNCLKYLSDLEKLRIIINTSLINDHSSVNMLFIFEQFQVNLTTLSKKIILMENKVKEQVIEETKKHAESLNIDDAIEKIIPLWNIVSKTVSVWKKKFDIVNNSAYSSFKTYGKTFFNITSLLFFIVSIFVIIFTLILIRYSLIYIFEKQIITNVINTPNTKPISVWQNYKKRIIYKLKRYKPHNAAIYTYLIVFSLLLVIMVTFAITIINVSHLLYNEACIQLWNPKGFQTMDNFFDIFLKTHWGFITSKIVSQNSVIPISIPRPNQILHCIKSNCQKDYGILNGLNISRFINLSSIIWTPDFTKALHDGLNLTYQTFIRTDTKSMIPSDMGTFINTALSVGKYFDEISYQSTIAELSKGVIELNDYQLWIKSALDYFLSLNITNSNGIIRVLTKINSNIPNIQKLENDIRKLKLNFQIIQDKRNNSLYIKNLMLSIKNVQANMVDSPNLYNEMKILYNLIMMNEFPSNLVTFIFHSIEEILRILFPCKKLLLAVSGILSNLCSNNYTLEIISSYGLNFGLLSIFIIMMFHFLWIIIRKDLVENEELNISTC